MTDFRVVSLHKDFKTVGQWAQELAPKEIAILTKQKISQERTQKEIHGKGLLRQ
jgi:hypothetical protein